MAIKRYLNDTNLIRLMQESGFLLKNIINSEGELILCLRENYFNIYYRGNSLAKVSFKSENKYTVDIHSKFIPTELINDPDFSNKYKVLTIKGKETIYRFNIEQCELRKLLQKTYIASIKEKIIKVGYKEELEFQHLIMSDNILNEKDCLIDIQITDKYANGKRMDLMGLKQIDGNLYRMVIMEVKLGNNEELKEKVYRQIKDYSDHVKKYFTCYKHTYEEQYRQLKQLGLLPSYKYETIVIDDEIEEMIIVGRYLAKAQKQITELIINHPDIEDKIRLLAYIKAVDIDRKNMYADGFFTHPQVK
ncbi:hypothetical protein LGK95_03770 [Clostridium algoriphilum]|uniref:hypothetical protein n=1 Tax=Clostridium algoriphilum TaxID=198347 RepID=UPI001CF3B17F|nr:hypothetical protein [Clostridium algoriphilum]MCB2292654.1 hypothetical protein [Clostridium algoriphilum]